MSRIFSEHPFDETIFLNGQNVLILHIVLRIVTTRTDIVKSLKPCLSILLKVYYEN